MQLPSQLTDEELAELKRFTEWLAAVCLKHGIARDDLYKRIDDILEEQLRRL